MSLLRRFTGYLSKTAGAGGFLLLAIFAVSLSAQDLAIKTTYRSGDLKLVQTGKAADIIVSPGDFKVVQIAAGDLASDIERVSGIKPRVTSEAAYPTAVIVGTLGRSTLVDGLANKGKIQAARIRGKWESFLIATVKNPLPNLDRALVIAGSDRRGTAYGVYELSRMIGVSPWYWWADVTPERKSSLAVSPGAIYGGEPSVKYRGIFLNDEDWGLQPWAAKTFEPETGDIGPKTYARVCELLLRLKANTLWPAMHEVTRPFNSIPGNAKIADDYAIVMGSSHAEPMLRNNVGEWKAAKEDYNFVTNPGGVTAYWEQRARENAAFENIYTLGMRGIHDSPIQGAKDQAERAPLLDKIFSVQRGLLGKYVDRDIEKIPQIFCPYKEVLTDYRAGLKVPADVTIVFPDDNFGYIRQFPTPEEQKRKGGFGVYYHISYLGRPLSYLWLNTTPPALIWEEMSKAYEHGMRQLWIVNVGDIKPGEIGMEFFLQMAWDIKRWRRDNLKDYLRDWAAREFGAANAAGIADVMDAYYRLGFARKPEHLQWYLPNETPRTSDLTNDERLERYFLYAGLRRKAEAFHAALPPDKKDAFYELVLYTVRGAALANERFFAAELANEGESDAAVWARRSIAANAAIIDDAKYFNETLAGGKWRGIMSPEMNPGQWPSMRSTPPKIAESVLKLAEDAGNTYERVSVRAIPSTSQRSGSVFRESGGAVSFEAEHFTRKIDLPGAAWQIVPGLGRSGDSVAVFPTTAEGLEPGNIVSGGPVLEYEFHSVTGGEHNAVCYLIPTQPLKPGTGLRYAIGIDNETPQLVAVGLDAEVSSPKWAQNVLNATATGAVKLTFPPGRHTLKIYMVDAGVVIDKIVLSTGAVKPGYFGPPEKR